MTYFDYDGFADGQDGRLDVWDDSVEKWLGHSHENLQNQMEAELEQIDRRLEQREEIHIEIV